MYSQYSVQCVQGLYRCTLILAGIRTKVFLLVDSCIYSTNGMANAEGQSLVEGS